MEKLSKEIAKNRKTKKIKEIYRYLKHLFERTEHEWAELLLPDEATKCHVTSATVLNSAIIKCNILNKRGSHLHSQRHCYHWNTTPPTLDLAEKVHTKMIAIQQKAEKSDNKDQPETIDQPPSIPLLEPDAIQSVGRVNRRHRIPEEPPPSLPPPEKKVFDLLNQTSKRLDQAVEDFINLVKRMDQPVVPKQPTTPMGLFPMLEKQMEEIYGDLNLHVFHGKGTNYYLSVRFQNEPFTP